MIFAVLIGLALAIAAIGTQRAWVAYMGSRDTEQRVAEEFRLHLTEFQEPSERPSEKPHAFCLTNKKLSKREIEKMMRDFREAQNTGHMLVLPSEMTIVPLPVDNWYEEPEEPAEPKDPTPEELEAQAERILRNIQQINEEPLQ